MVTAFSKNKKLLPTILFLLLASLATATNTKTVFSPLSEESIVDVQSEVVWSSPSVAVPPSQPKCWVDAFSTLFQSTDDQAICEQMEPLHRKALAFEVARCHLQDAGRSIFGAFVGGVIEKPEDCTVFHDGLYPNLKLCLSYMTETSFQVYTFFLTQVMQLCNGLTQHLAIDFQKQTFVKLAQMSQQAFSQVTDMLLHQQNSFHQREEAMKQEHKEFYAKMNEHQEELMQGHSSWTSGIMESFQKQQEAWFANQTSFIEELQRVHKERSMALLKFFQQFLNPDFWVSLATRGYTIFAFLFHILSTLNVTWLLTRPRRCRGVRTYIFTIVLMEFCCELCVSFAAGNASGSVEQKSAIIKSLRNTAMFLGGLIYAMGLLFSCCCGHNDDYDDDDMEDFHDEPIQQNSLGQQDQQIQLAITRLVDEAIARRSEPPQLLQPVNASAFLLRDHQQRTWPSLPTNSFLQGQNHLITPDVVSASRPMHRRSRSDPQVDSAGYNGMSGPAGANSSISREAQNKKGSMVGTIVSPFSRITNSNGRAFTPIRHEESTSGYAGSIGVNNLPRRTALDSNGATQAGQARVAFQQDQGEIVSNSNRNKKRTSEELRTRDNKNESENSDDENDANPLKRRRMQGDDQEDEVMNAQDSSDEYDTAMEEEEGEEEEDTTMDD